MGAGPVAAMLFEGARGKTEPRCGIGCLQKLRRARCCLLHDVPPSKPGSPTAVIDRTGGNWRSTGVGMEPRFGPVHLYRTGQIRHAARRGTRSEGRLVGEK